MENKTLLDILIEQCNQRNISISWNTLPSGNDKDKYYYLIGQFLVIRIIGNRHLEENLETYIEKEILEMMSDDRYEREIRQTTVDYCIGEFVIKRLLLCQILWFKNNTTGKIVNTNKLIQSAVYFM